MQIMDGFTSAGASDIIRVPDGCSQIGFKVTYTDNESDSASDVSAISMAWQALDETSGKATDSGLLSNPALAIGSTAENVANGAFGYRIAGTNYTKAAVSAGTAITAFGTIAASKYGGFIVQINAAGTVSMKAPAKTQSYATDVLASTAVNALTADSGNIIIGKVLIQNDASLWTAGTDDLTDGSDVTKANFINQSLQGVDVASYTFGAADITNRTAWFSVGNHGEKYGRLYLKTITGTGEVDAFISFRLNT